MSNPHTAAPLPWLWGGASEFNRAIANSNPKRDRAHAIAAEVRARRPEMQVKRITKGQP